MVSGGILLGDDFHRGKVLLQAGAFNLRYLLGVRPLCHDDQVVIAAREVLERFGNAGDDLHRMLGDAEGKRADALAQLRREWLYAETLKGTAQRVGEAIEPVSMREDRFAFDLIEALAHLLRRELVMVQKGNEVGNRPLEVDVVLPERIIGVDEQRLRDSVLDAGEHEGHEVRKNEVMDKSE